LFYEDGQIFSFPALLDCPGVKGGSTGGWLGG
jgi:hypothetical protein